MPVCIVSQRMETCKELEEKVVEVPTLSTTPESSDLSDRFSNKIRGYDFDNRKVKWRKTDPFINKSVELILTSQDDYNLWTRFKLPLVGEIRFNPIVSAASILLIFGFVTCSVIWGQVNPFAIAQAVITDKFTWLYIGSINCWFAFVLCLYFR